MDFAKRADRHRAGRPQRAGSERAGWCGTGSIDEDQHLGAGLSHILEHMLFKGTKTQRESDCSEIQDVGGYINAYTSFDRTVYWIDVPKDGVSPRSRS